jgi:multidrug efflux pump
VQNRLSPRHAAPAAGRHPAGRARGQGALNFLLFTILSSDNPAFDPVALGDYAARNVLPEMQRLPGVGQAQLFGTERAMRIWLDPAKLVGFGLSTRRHAAIRAQNAQVSSAPSATCPTCPARPCSPPWWSTASSPASSSSATSAARQRRRLGRAAEGRGAHRAGRQTYATAARLNGKPSTGIGVQLSPSGNALATAKAVRTSAWTSCSATSQRA